MEANFCIVGLASLTEDLSQIVFMILWEILFQYLKKTTRANFFPSEKDGAKEMTLRILERELLVVLINSRQLLPIFIDSRFQYLFLKYFYKYVTDVLYSLQSINVLRS